MNTFLTLVCLALVASAAANGYNYQQPRPIARQPLRPLAPINNNGIYSGQQAPPLPSLNVQSPPLINKQNYIAPAPVPANQYIPPIDIRSASPQYPQQQLNVPQSYPQPENQYIPPLQQPSSYNPVGSPSFNYPTQQQQQTIISKDIYIHSSPDETEEVGIEQGDYAPNRKNYRIVFIKAPSQSIRVNMQDHKQASNEEKTIIYVLSKKPEIIKNQITTLQSDQKANKPEVYFIKYKTQEEAQRAQQEIQAQYDALGGSTQISDEGFAPVTSVIGGGPVNIGSASAGAGPSFSGNTNFLQSASSNQQQFAQQSYQGSHASSTNVNFNVAAPSTKYLPVKKK